MKKKKFFLLRNVEQNLLKIFRASSHTNSTNYFQVAVETKMVKTVSNKTQKYQS